MNETITATRSWLNRKSILVPDDWLQACVEWIHEENQNSSLPQHQMCQLVYDQWLLSDLHELSTKCLPEVITSSSKYQLKGTYALQIDSVVDISQSFYSQLQKVKGTANENAGVSADTSDNKPWEPKASRMLMMKLTDGTNNVQGMEYRPISALNTKLSPGTKITVHGSILCRRGVLMLNDKNITVMGGEVDSLMEANSQDIILQQFLQSSANTIGHNKKQEFNATPARNNKTPSSRQTTSRPSQVSQIERFSSKKAVKEESEFDDELLLDEFMDDFDVPMGDNSVPSNQNHRNSYKQSPVDVSSSVATNKRPYSSTSQHFDGVSTKSQIGSTGIQGQQSVLKSNFAGNNNSFRENKNYQNCNENAIGNKKIKMEVRPEQKTIHHNTLSSSEVKPCDDDSLFTDDFDDEFADELELMNVMETAGPSMSIKNKNIPLRDNANLKKEVNNSGMTSSLSKNTKLESTNTYSSVTQVKKSTNTSYSSGNSAKQSTNTSYSSGNSAKQSTNTSYSSGNSAKKSTNTSYSSGNSAKQSTQSVERRVLNNSGQTKLTDFVNSDQQQAKIGLNAEPFTYLSVVNKHLPAKGVLTFKVKAYISTLVGRLESVDGTAWKLACKINDGTASLDVDLSNRVLTKLIGFSAPDSMEMKKRAKSDKSVREFLIEGIQQCQQKLIELLGVMEIQTSPQLIKPVVMAINETTPSDLTQLHDRVMSMHVGFLLL